LDGRGFEEWEKWKIIIGDVGCGGCGFWRNGTIYLASNCSQELSYLCDGDLGKFFDRFHVFTFTFLVKFLEEFQLR
jgi:hypothetical protein